jgi:chromosome segregation ATPase
VVADLTLQTLIELRAEVREFRDESRNTLGQHGHRLNLLTEQMRDQSNRFAQLETHMAALLATMPHVHTRVDELAARLAKVEEKLSTLS